MNTGTSNDTRPSPHPRGEQGRHRLTSSTPAQFRMPYVVKVNAPVAAGLPTRRTNTYRPGVTSSQQLVARVRGGVA